MANSQVLIPQFRFDDSLLAGLMAGEGRDPATSGLHAAIITASRATAERCEGVER
jgi:flagellar transcriptional activator FlhD